MLLVTKGAGFSGIGPLKAGTGLGVKGTGERVGSVSHILSCWRMIMWLSAVSCATGKPAEGLAMALVRSLRLARVRDL